MHPVAYYPDPFRGGDNIIVLTDCYQWSDSKFTNLVPANTNFRHHAKAVFEAAAHMDPWFGIEQEYTLLEIDNKFTKKILGWPDNGFPGPQGPYYCAVGANKAYGRKIADEHYKACLHAGLNISGINGEVMPGQWEYQIGPCKGIDGADQLWIARYLLERVAEMNGAAVSIAPKIFKEYNGSGAHVNLCNSKMRSDGGMAHIDEVCKKFAAKHALHLELYGDNSQRLTGHHETSDPKVFSYATGNRAASVRIPTSTAAKNGKGYIEDRRPASDVNPYLVYAAITDTMINEESKIEPLLKHYRQWVEWKKTAEIV